nr:Ig-like domain-containing protein [uncultured Aminipila sp.]
MKRFLAILMTLCLVLGLSSVSAWATDEGATWQEETTMPIKPNTLGACTIGENIYVIGNNLDHSLAIYNTKTKTWKKGTPMPDTPNGSRAVAIGNKIYVVGTFRVAGWLYVYDSSTDKWVQKPEKLNLIDNRIDLVAIGSKIFLVNSDRKSISVYDTVSEKWTHDISSYDVVADPPNVCAHGENIYFVGGNGSKALKIYNTADNTWKDAKPRPTGRSGSTAVMVENNMYVIGGSDNSNGTTLVDIYNTETDSWSTGNNFITPRTDLEAQVIDGKIYIIGGTNYNLPTQRVNTIESLQVGNSSDDSAAKLSVLLNEGETVQLSTSFDLDNNKNFTWSSTNEAVATVDANGKVTAVAEGTADIYAQNADGSFKEYIPVKVVKGVADELRLAVHLKIGEKAKLYLTNDTSKVTWTSMDESIATVSADGQVSGIKKGLAIIKGELEGKSYQIYVRING